MNGKVFEYIEVETPSGSSTITLPRPYTTAYVPTFDSLGEALSLFPDEMKQFEPKPGIPVPASLAQWHRQTLAAIQSQSETSDKYTCE